MANNTIGKCDCPVCGLEAEVRESKKAKAYILCDDCGFQGFARGAGADLALRAKMRGSATAKIDIPATDIYTIEPGAILSEPDIPIPPVTEEKPPAFEKAADSEQDLTIFDSKFWSGKK